jgi:hypothetical protein
LIIRYCLAVLFDGFAAFFLLTPLDANRVAPVHRALALFNQAQAVGKQYFSLAGFFGPGGRLGWGSGWILCGSGRRRRRRAR